MVDEHLGSLAGLKGEQASAVTHVQLIIEQKALFKSEHEILEEQKDIVKAVEQGSLDNLEKAMKGAQEEAILTLKRASVAINDTFLFVKKEFLAAKFLSRVEKHFAKHISKTKSEEIKRLEKEDLDEIDKRLHQLSHDSLAELKRILKEVYGIEAGLSDRGDVAFMFKKVQDPTFIRSIFERMRTKGAVKGLMKTAGRFQKDAHKIADEIEKLEKDDQKKKSLEEIKKFSKKIKADIEKAFDKGEKELKDLDKVITEDMLVLSYIVHAEELEEKEFDRWGEGHFVPMSIKDLSGEQIKVVENFERQVAHKVSVEVFQLQALAKSMTK